MRFIAFFMLFFAYFINSTNFVPFYPFSVAYKVDFMKDFHMILTIFLSFW